MKNKETHKKKALVVGPKYLIKNLESLEEFSFECFEDSALNKLTQESFFEIIQNKEWDVLIILCMKYLINNAM